MSNEPSMEDILSSIKRIIAEDSDVALSAPRGRRSVAGASGAGASGNAAPAARDAAPADPSDVLELTDAVPSEEHVAVTEANDTHIDQPESKPPLVSDAALNASRSAIAALSALVIKPEITGSDTLEGLVREMLKPMLAEWLDQRLPDVVERLVAQEISRITARG